MLERDSINPFERSALSAGFEEALVRGVGAEGGTNEDGIADGRVPHAPAPMVNPAEREDCFGHRNDKVLDTMLSVVPVVGIASDKDASIREGP